MPIDRVMKKKKGKLKYSRQAGLFLLIFFAFFTLSLATESVFSRTHCKCLREINSDLWDWKSVLDESHGFMQASPPSLIPAHTTQAQSSDA